MVDDGQQGAKDSVLFTWDPYTNPIMTDVAGLVRFVDIVEDETVREELDEITGRRQRVIIEDQDRKSTRLNSSHRCISYDVFCLKKKKTKEIDSRLVLNKM